MGSLFSSPKMNNCMHIIIPFLNFKNNEDIELILEKIKNMNKLRMYNLKVNQKNSIYTILDPNSIGLTINWYSNYEHKKCKNKKGLSIFVMEKGNIIITNVKIYEDIMSIYEYILMFLNIYPQKNDLVDNPKNNPKRLITDYFENIEYIKASSI